MAKKTKLKKQLQFDQKFALIRMPEQTKPTLVRLQDKRGEYQGVIQNKFSLEAPEHVAIDNQDIICVFPHDVPYFGKYLGAKIEPLLSISKQKPWGRIAVYRHMTEADEKVLQKGLQLTFDNFIKPNKLKYLLPIQLEIRHQDGKMSGYYQRDKKNDSDPTICLCPPSFITDDKAKLVLRILSHELAHEFYDLYLANSIKARWVKLFHSYTTIKEYKKEELHSQWKDLIDSGSLVSAYRKDLADEQRLFFDCSIKWIKNSSKVSLKDLDLLRESGDNLADIWPSTNVHLSEMITPVSKYAGKAPVELWCESVSLWACGEELPKAVTKLVQRSLRPATKESDT